MLSAIATGIRTSVRVAETGIAAEPTRFGARVRPPRPVASMRTGGRTPGTAAQTRSPRVRTAAGAAHVRRVLAPVASSSTMPTQGDAPDLQTQLESLLHHVWTEEARWRCAEREQREDDDQESGWHVI